MDARIEAFKKLSVAAVSDALDRLGLHGARLGIAPFDATSLVKIYHYLPVLLRKNPLSCLRAMKG